MALPKKLSQLCQRRDRVGAYVQTIEDEVKRAVGDRQFGIGISDGTTQAYHTLAAAIQTHPDKVGLALDVKGAFPSVSR